MKLQVLQEELSKTLSTAARFTKAKVQLPVLANILMQAKKNKLIISATNLEISISISIGAKVAKEGEITIPSRTISDLVSNLNPGQINLESQKEIAKITSSNFVSSISGMNAADFPAVPNSVGKNSLQLLGDRFLDALSSVLFAVSVDETRPVLTGVLVIIKKDNLTLVATDGFRLSQEKIKLEKSHDFKEQDIIIPKNVLSELLRVGDGEEKINFSYQATDNQVVFGVNGVVLSSRVIEGKFPDFERIIPKRSKIKIDLDKKEFLQAVKLASVFARDSANVVKVDVGSDQIEIFAESKAGGSQKTTVDAKVNRGGLVEKEKFVVAFNYRFLEDFLNSIKSEDVKLELSDPNAPVVFLDAKDSSFLHIIMPVKLQE
jgi:DNA polymerase-3 subunit beta